MKKLLVLLLIFGITAGAFAQLATTISLDFNPDLMKVVSPTGDNAKKILTDSFGAKEYNENFSDGSFDFLSSSQFAKDNEARIRFDWSGEGWSARLRVRADSLFVNSGVANTGNGRGLTLQGFLNSAIDLWYIKGTAGILSYQIGTDGDRGKTANFRFDGDFNDNVKLKIDNFGVAREREGLLFPVVYIQPGFWVGPGFLRRYWT